MDRALQALADPHRREILRLAWSKELPAGEIASHFAMARPSVSYHLRILTNADLLAERRAGTRRLYKARTETMQSLRQFFEDYWDWALPRLRDVAEADQANQRRKRRTTKKED